MVDSKSHNPRSSLSIINSEGSLSIRHRHLMSSDEDLCGFELKSYFLIPIEDPTHICSEDGIEGSGIKFQQKAEILGKNVWCPNE